MSSLEDLEKRIKALEESKQPKPIKEKAPRELSEYNKFIQKKIAEIKKKDPKKSHKDAFSEATKEWSKTKTTGA